MSLSNQKQGGRMPRGTKQTNKKRQKGKAEAVLKSSSHVFFWGGGRVGVIKM